MIRQASTPWSFLTKNPPLLPAGACIQSQVLWTATPSLSHRAPVLPPSPGNVGPFTPLSLKALSSRGRQWGGGGGGNCPWIPRSCKAPGKLRAQAPTPASNAPSMTGRPGSRQTEIQVMRRIHPGTVRGTKQERETGVARAASGLEEEEEA